ncbi:MULTISPECIES: hypothetical protein [unclassified Lactococcus]|uniref:hypothetical protein n=1 Tax=unclassified Lactococcus TaxID=2643510 RepID=UPI0011C83DEE|nr:MULTISPECIES: hypothetical protein [unclassified Lactococcus]MQW22344.1 hypothetical protein [Lactococcus sp. dk101]TXK45383.1 hypothetical protein FVP42_00095 [Lactococcus sp. dk310]TXK51716.1 hypothetical protein FVP43_00095 [Lactococcus sp. dk322]
MSKKTNRSTKIVLRQLAATAALGTMMVAPLAPTVNVLAKSVTSSQSVRAAISGTGSFAWGSGMTSQSLANSISPNPAGSTATVSNTNSNWNNLLNGAPFNSTLSGDPITMNSTVTGWVVNGTGVSGSGLIAALNASNAGTYTITGNATDGSTIALTVNITRIDLSSLGSSIDTIKSMLGGAVTPITASKVFDGTNAFVYGTPASTAALTATVGNTFTDTNEMDTDTSGTVFAGMTAAAQQSLISGIFATSPVTVSVDGAAPVTLTMGHLTINPIDAQGNVVVSVPFTATGVPTYTATLTFAASPTSNAKTGTASTAQTVTNALIGQAIQATYDNANVASNHNMTITGIDASKLNVSLSAAQLQTLQALLASTGALPFFTPGNNIISQATAPQDLTLSGKVSGTTIAANISSPTASAAINAGLAADAKVVYTLTPDAGGTPLVSPAVAYGTAYDFTGLPTNTKYHLSAKVTTTNFTAPNTPTAIPLTTGFASIALTAQAHVQGLGWMSAITDPGKGDFIGTTGRSLRMEAAHLTGGSDGAGGTYTLSGSAHLQDLGDVDGTVDANGLLTLGTTGQSRRMEGLSLKVNSTNPNLRVFYRVHVQGSGWTGWFSDGQFAGTKGKSLRMEALEVHVIDPTAGDALPF